MTKQTTIALLTVAVILPLWVSQGDGVPQDNATVKIMRAKLDASHKSLEAIAVADYLKIAEAGHELAELSARAEWFARQDDEYMRMSREFRHHAMEMARNAQFQQLDSATLHYMRMTMVCVDCHKALRDPNVVRPMK